MNDFKLKEIPKTLSHERLKKVYDIYEKFLESYILKFEYQLKLKTLE